MNRKDTVSTLLVRLKRVSHTKAGGRVAGYQGIAIAGNRKDLFGWAISRGNTYQDCKLKVLKKAQMKMRKVYFNEKQSTLWNDYTIKFGSYKILLKKQKEGMGITASPTVSSVLSLCGIQNACVKTFNRPDSILLLRTLSIFTGN